MDWAEINIYTSSEGVEPLTGVLLGIGITGFAVKDPNDIQDLLEHKTGNWDYIDEEMLGLKDCETSVTVYLPKNEQGAQMLCRLNEELAALKERDTDKLFGKLEYDENSVRDEDWANNWKKYFKPIEIGKRLIVKPSWEKLDENEKRTVLEIDPASSFGTGQHNTTRLCLEMLEENIAGGEKLLDIGCGSGILSIGALLLGAESAAAVDIDQNSVKIAAENAEKNNIAQERFSVFCGNITEDEQLVQRLGSGYDIVCANIVADVIIPMSSHFPKFIKKGGKLIISGIIDSRKQQTTDAVTNSGFEMICSRSLDDWNAACFVKT